MDYQIKCIVLPDGDNKTTNTNKNIENKVKDKRKVTHQKQWDFDESELLSDKQFGYIEQIYHKNYDNVGSRMQHIYNVIERQIKTKIQGYYQQDLKKKLYDKDKFITLPKVIELLYSCKNTCYYCRKDVFILYEYVRDNKQWSVERRNNDYGHNCDNVEIACLHCNISRKTMNEERYLFTKQLNIIKQS